MKSYPQLVNPFVCSFLFPWSGLPFVMGLFKIQHPLATYDSSVNAVGSFGPLSKQPALWSRFMSTPQCSCDPKFVLDGTNTFGHRPYNWAKSERGDSSIPGGCSFSVTDDVNHMTKRMIKLRYMQLLLLVAAKILMTRLAQDGVDGGRMDCEALS